MTTDFEDLFGRLSDHEHTLAETLGELSELSEKAVVGANADVVGQTSFIPPASAPPSNTASDSQRLERILSRLAEAGESGIAVNRDRPGGSRFFSPEELAKAIQRGANGDVQMDQRDRLMRESSELLKSIDKKLDALAEAEKERFF